MKKWMILTSLALCTATQPLRAQAVEQAVRERLDDYFKTYVAPDAETGRCKLDSVLTDFDRRRLTIYASDAFGYQPFRPQKVEEIYRQLRRLLPGPVNYFQLEVRTGGYTIDQLVPNYYRKGRDADKQRLYTPLKQRKEPAWVSRLSTPYKVTEGLQGHHLSLWQSHGRYFVNKEQKWGWQRPRLFCTTEDLFTQSFVVPYLIPMLERAGAVVYTPRERDVQRHEVIVDNDGRTGSSLYIEQPSRKARWQAAPEPGFAWQQTVCQDNENPFVQGSARYAPTERKAGRAFAEWVPDIPETGDYAVYVSYQTLPQSVSDARYTVFHSGGVTEFKVNQRMGGGTWVYLGTFRFDQGRNDYGMVTLSNESGQQGVVCADAVRFGGGMGNVARGGTVSGLPRYLEGARYAALWNGMPPEVYNGYQGQNDYSDDINVRSRTLNYLNGGSAYNPQQPGKGVPFELNLALHSDAGYHTDDHIVGALGVYTTRFNEGMLGGGTNRLASRDLVDLCISQLDTDIQARFGNGWTRRSLWDRNYSETRLPSVASCIVELLSHQNFADMRLGHDPLFKFTVARSLYKAVLRFVSTQHHTAYTVQPLPVSHFALTFGKKKNTVELSWRDVDDPTEPTAKPRQYVVYTRIGRGGFDNGTLVSGTSYTARIEPGVVYSFQVTAVNEGGESFPSEILSACKARHEKRQILIVNGFDRLSGPAVVNTPKEAGFDLHRDPGIPYLRDISLCGYQQVFDRSEAGKRLGESDNSLEGVQMAGNSFDYPFIHGKALQAAGGYSFVSCSDEVVEENLIPLYRYDAIDYILGAEKEETGLPASPTRYYKTFTSGMQRALSSYLSIGGRLLVSGAYVTSDMQQSEGNRQFVRQWLKCDYAGTGQADDENSFRMTGLGASASLTRVPNETVYALPSTDSLTPVDGSFPVLSYGSGQTAATAYRSAGFRTFVLGFPLECVTEESVRNQWMASAMKFLTDKSK